MTDPKTQTTISKPKPMQHGSPDNFQTPPHALDPLMPYINKNWRIWEPSCGKGNLVNSMKERGYRVYGSDIQEELAYDFLTYNPCNFDCIVTNPPFSIKQKFLARCYELEKPFALLMPLTTFDSKERQRLFHDNGIQVIFMPKRISFETPSGKGTGSWFMTAWFCWRLNLPSQLVFTGFDKSLLEAA